MYDTTHVKVPLVYIIYTTFRLHTPIRVQDIQCLCTTLHFAYSTHTFTAHQIRRSYNMSICETEGNSESLACAAKSRRCAAAALLRPAPSRKVLPYFLTKSLDATRGVFPVSACAVATPGADTSPRKPIDSPPCTAFKWSMRYSIA